MSGSFDGFVRLVTLLSSDKRGEMKALTTTLALEDHFKSVNAVFRASRKELLAVPGMTNYMVNRIHDVRALAQHGQLPKPKKVRAPRCEP